MVPLTDSSSESSDGTVAMLVAAARSIWAAAESEPMPFDDDDELRLSARRLLELAGEHLDAISALREACLYRPAHAVLRALLEVMVTLAWIAADPDRYAPLFWRAQMPPARNVFERVGWGAEYSGAYAFLSELVHPTEQRIHIYRHADVGTDGLFPEVVPDGEMYVLEGEPGGAPYVSFTPMTTDEAHAVYGPYLCLKALDVTLAGLTRFFGPDAPWELPWWPHDEARRFAAVLREDAELAKRMISDPAGLVGQQRLDLDGD